jgi:thiamine biosynthesis lipoprotein ApbE
VARTATEAEALTKAIIILDGAQGFTVVSQFSGPEGLLAHPNGRQISTPGFTETVRFEASAATSREGAS